MLGLEARLKRILIVSLESVLKKKSTRTYFFSNFHSVVQFDEVRNAVPVYDLDESPLVVH